MYLIYFCHVAAKRKVVNDEYFGNVVCIVCFLYHFLTCEQSYEQTLLRFLFARGSSESELSPSHSQKNWMGMCGPLPKTLTLLRPKSATFIYLFMT